MLSMIWRCREGGYLY